MKRFFCTCGSQVFFDNHQCLSCGTPLGFDPGSMTMMPVGGSNQLTYCDNHQHDVCNWLRPAYSDHDLCFGCQFNRTIPNLSLDGNLARWAVLEEAKKRLFFTLIRLGVPLTNGWQDSERGLLLDFPEDARSKPGVFPETFVSTGYLGGVITINALEADDVARAAVRAELRESYRTVLGHLRHESGHYYWSRLDPDDETRAAFADVFGDESRDYSGALELHYKNGPPEGWREFYISAYASAHP